MNPVWRAFEADPLEGMAESPYPGLRPFLPRERDIFFGREQMVDQVLVRLNEKHMVVVHGASGCGKSSLIAAGVLPQLARRRARRGLVLKTGTFRPGAKPMQSLVGLLGELCGTEAGPAKVEDVYRAIAGGEKARANVARLAAGAGVDQICIVVDQFEELFRFAEDEGFDEAQRFAELLVQLCGCDEHQTNWWENEGEARPIAAATAEISFILTMRSEFLGNCARYRGLAEAINRTQYLLPNMARADLIRAIREPAEVFDGSVDHVLAEKMADDAEREEDSLPLVQHALMQMWRASESRALTLADYERALEDCAQSGQAKQRSPLGAILACHADRVLAEVTEGDPARLAAVEFIFRALTRKDSESRAIRCPQRFRRLTRLSGVSHEETRAIVDAFRRDGVSFLTPYGAEADEIDDGTVVDISHEALIRVWPRMSDRAIDQETAQPVGWIEREAQDAMLWRWLSVHAEFFATNRKAYLDGATTERLGKWFDRIRGRPDWARPHLVRPEGLDDVTQEPEWRAVEKLLKESHERNWLDRTMLRRWRKLGWGGLVLLPLVIAGGAFTLYRFDEVFRGETQSLRQTLARRTIESVLPKPACSWLDIGEVRGEEQLTIALRGVAGDAEASRREISGALSRAGLANVRLDYSGVAPMNEARCALLDAYREVRNWGPPRMTAEQPHNDMELEVGGPAGPRATVMMHFDLSGPPTDLILLRIQPSGLITIQNFDRASDGNGHYTLRSDLEQGRSGIVLLTGTGPFDPALVAPGNGERGTEWRTRFRQAARERGWRAEMVWFETAGR